MGRKSSVLDIGRLARARLDAGLAVVDVARRAGIGRSTAYVAFARGQAGPRVAKRIAEALGVALGDLWAPADSLKGAAHD